MRTVTLGPIGRVYADQMQSLNSILVLSLIPVADRLVYPLVRRLCRRRKEASGTIYPTALQRMGLGMLCCVGGFVLAANLQQRIERQELAYAIPPNGWTENKSKNRNKEAR